MLALLEFERRNLNLADRPILSSSAKETASKSFQLAHTVFFTLNTPTEESRQCLIDSCHHHLSDHPGTLLFGVGTRATGYTRPVNDTRFDVVLYLVFATQRDHDAYQQAPRHQRFIEENRETWSEVRVFDSHLMD